MTNQLDSELDQYGYSILEQNLTSDQCQAIVASYSDDSLFRSRVVMARHGFGRGEYRYFSYPLPHRVAELRRSLYPPLAAVANRWVRWLHHQLRPLAA